MDLFPDPTTPHSFTECSASRLLNNIVRRQVFWNQCALKLRESLAHLVGLIMQRAGGDASAALRVSFVYPFPLF